MNPDGTTHTEGFTTPVGRLAVHRFGADPVRWVALHGFTLGGPSLGSVARHLPGATLAPDLPGHGATDVAPIDLGAAITALSALLAAQTPPPVLIGYSQGGRVGVHIAIRYPDLLSGLVMVSASTGLAATERASRAIRDARQADEIERIGVEAFIDGWLGASLTGTRHLPRHVAAPDRMLRVGNTAAGLAAALRGLGQGAVPRVDPSAIPVPSLWIAGNDDERYRSRLEKDATAAGGQFVTVAGGHNLVLENPQAVAGAIVDWTDGAMRDLAD